jgi:hypothetical protein
MAMALSVLSVVGNFTPAAPQNTTSNTLHLPEILEFVRTCYETWRKYQVSTEQKLAITLSLWIKLSTLYHFESSLSAGCGQLSSSHFCKSSKNGTSPIEAAVQRQHLRRQASKSPGREEGNVRFGSLADIRACISRCPLYL